MNINNKYAYQILHHSDEGSSDPFFESLLSDFSDADKARLSDEFFLQQSYHGELTAPVQLFTEFISHFLPGFSQEEIAALPSAYQDEMEEQIRIEFKKAITQFGQFLLETNDSEFQNLTTNAERKKSFRSFLYTYQHQRGNPPNSIINHIVLLSVLWFFQKTMYNTIDEADKPQGQWTVRYANQNKELSTRSTQISQTFTVESLDIDGSSSDEEIGQAQERKEELSFKNSQVEQTIGAYKQEIETMKTFRSQVQKVFEKSQEDKQSFSKLFISYYDKLNGIMFKILQGLQQ